MPRIGDDRCEIEDQKANVTIAYCKAPEARNPGKYSENSDMVGHITELHVGDTPSSVRSAASLG